MRLMGDTLTLKQKQVLFAYLGYNACSDRRKRGKTFLLRLTLYELIEESDYHL